MWQIFGSRHTYDVTYRSGLYKKSGTALCEVGCTFVKTYKKGQKNTGQAVKEGGEVEKKSVKNSRGNTKFRKGGISMVLEQISTLQSV